MVQMKFLGGKLVGENETVFTKAVGLRFNKASETLKVGEVVQVKPVEVTGFKNVLGVFNSEGQVGNVLSNKGLEELEFEMTGGKVFTNHELVKNLNGLTFRVKSVGQFGAVLTVSF